MTRMGWLSIVAFCVGGAALIAAMLARRGFLGKINGLQRSLEQAPKALTARTDLPPQVLALARRLGVSDSDGGRLVRLTQSGEMRLKPGTSERNSRPKAASDMASDSWQRLGRCRHRARRDRRFFLTLADRVTASDD